MAEISLDPYLLDCLLPDLVGHDRRPASFIIYLYLYRQASQNPDWSVRISHQAMAIATGLSRSAVQSALAHLQKRQLIASSRASHRRAASSCSTPLVATQSQKVTPWPLGRKCLREPRGLSPWHSAKSEPSRCRSRAAPRGQAPRLAGSALNRHRDS